MKLLLLSIFPVGLFVAVALWEFVWRRQSPRCVHGIENSAKVVCAQCYKKARHIRPDQHTPHAA